VKNFYLMKGMNVGHYKNDPVASVFFNLHVVVSKSHTEFSTAFGAILELRCKSGPILIMALKDFI